MKVKDILAQIKVGKTLYIQTALKVFKIDNRCINRFKKAGYDVLKDGKDNEGGFYVANGKHYVYVCPGGCKVWLE